MNAQLLPAISSSSALERKYTGRILRLSPGLGDSAATIANSLADSGLASGAAAMLIQAVYNPNDHLGRGQSTRAAWFVEAIRTRYSHRLEKIRTDYKAFRSFLTDMEEVVAMRDELNGSGYSFTFHDAFELWELGENADSVLSIIQEFMEEVAYRPPACCARIRAAVKAVKAQRFTELSTAVQYLNPQ